MLQHDETKELYFGVTEDLSRRLKEHNSIHHGSTRRKSGKWVLVYAETYRSKSDALSREARLKYHGRAKQELIKRIEQSLIA